MKELFAFIIYLLSLFSALDARASSEIGLPIKFIEGCQDDFDHNGHDDIALLLKSSNKTLLIVLMKHEETNYESHLLFSGNSEYLRLRCEYRIDLVETKAGKGGGEPITITVDGKVLILYQSEASSMAFYWKNDRFERLWLSD